MAGHVRPDRRTPFALNGQTEHGKPCRSGRGTLDFSPPFRHNSGAILEPIALAQIELHSLKKVSRMVNPRFHQLVADAKTRIQEITPAEAAERQQAGEQLIDVRESDDYVKSHAHGALGLSKGVIELKIEEHLPNLAAEIICYCGGGSRSALVTDSLQKMGYANVRSMQGGFKKWRELNLPVDE